MKVVALALAIPFLLSGCAAASSAATIDEGAASELRLAFSANLTHAPALVAIDQGFLEAHLGDTVLTTSVFAAGPATIEAVRSGAIDAAYIGPSPAINTFLRSGGQSVVVIAGATVGGAALVVREWIDAASDLEGTTIASPQLGNTQDVALRTWLGDHGFETSTTGGGDVGVAPTENSDAFALFKAGQLDGAWVPEPWASRFVLEAGGHVLVDEAALWADGEFPTTVLIVSQNFFARHPETVDALLKAHVEAVDWLNEHPDDAARVLNARLKIETGKQLGDDVIARALESLRFTTDPIASAFPTLAARALAAGVGTGGDVDGLFDLAALNAILRANGAEPVSADGLGRE
jgi:NitT/TauT family transport system substrate-binding protein